MVCVQYVCSDGVFAVKCVCSDGMVSDGCVCMQLAGHTLLPLKGPG